MSANRFTWRPGRADSRARNERQATLARESARAQKLFGDAPPAPDAGVDTGPVASQGPAAASAARAPSILPIMIPGILLGGAVGFLLIAGVPRSLAQQPRPVAVGLGNTVDYANCDDVRRAGAAPLRRGEPGYSPQLDPGGDGVACPVTPPDSGTALAVKP